MEDKQKYKLRYLTMPVFVYQDNRLTDVSRRIYCFIHSYTNPFYFGNEHLADMFKCSTQAISDGIKLLQELKYIETQYRVKSGGGKIRLVIDLFSENKQMTNGVKKTKATTSHLLIDKESKEKNLKKNDVFDDPFKERREARAARKLKKGKVLGFGYKTVSWETEKTPTPKRDFTPLSDVELWELAKELNVPPYEPAKKQKEILEAYEDGSLPEKYGNSLTFVIKRFIRRGKDTGQIETLDQMGRLALEADHPDKIAERERIWREAEEKGVI